MKKLARNEIKKTITLNRYIIVMEFVHLFPSYAFLKVCFLN